MARNKFIPGPFFRCFVPNVRQKAEEFGLAPRRCRAGEHLTVPGTINNTAHMVAEGLIHVSLTSSSGNVKSLAFFGEGTVFPVGVVTHESLIDYEMVIRAQVPTTVYSMPYPTLRRMVEGDGELGARILEQSCQFTGYLFYQSVSDAFASSRVRVADVVYLLSRNAREDDMPLDLTQAQLADLVGVSRPQLERVVRDLRESGALGTGRGRLAVLDEARLLSFCSDDMRLYAQEQVDSAL